ncbi:AKT1-like K+ channel 1 [Striga asiatica]|uniref:AKT1-like K+ channel 1 n=1 Tax=Striga asiatica TaxID=4170 RepID=A0A5A7R751_STRAF|nr:AKT1-like K+ channel 1 [Striga asiatica]
MVSRDFLSHATITSKTKSNAISQRRNPISLLFLHRAPKITQAPDIDRERSDLALSGSGDPRSVGCNVRIDAPHSMCATVIGITFNGGGSSARTHAPTPLFEVIELIVDVKGCQQTIVIISWEKNPYPESKKLFTKIAVAYEMKPQGSSTIKQLHIRKRRRKVMVMRNSSRPIWRVSRGVMTALRWLVMISSQILTTEATYAAIDLGEGGDVQWEAREERSYNTSNMLTDTNHMLANGRMDVPLSLCFANARADDLLLHYLLRWGRELNELYRNNSTALVRILQVGSDLSEVAGHVLLNHLPKVSIILLLLTADAYLPVLENQKSFNKKAEEK